MEKKLHRPTYYTLRSIERLPEYARLSNEQRHALRVVGQVLPFRVNDYVTRNLIDWDAVPDDPMYQLTFLQRDMIPADAFGAVEEALERKTGTEEFRTIVDSVRLRLNPHPAGQSTANVPTLHDEAVNGLQHKYRETCLVFPASGQTCHSYCTFCFRWPQFVGIADLRFATDESRRYQRYIRRHTELTDVLLTGGDPMVMRASKLEAYVDPLLGPGFEHIRHIRIGTKSLAYWPYRFVSDADADDVLRLFERVVAAGKHLAVMAHFSHWRELSTPVVREAIRRIRSTGAEIRTQSPLLAHINDAPDTWSRMWTEQVTLGCLPYYFFVERDTGSSRYFAVPLARAWEVYREAVQRVSGLGRTVRGPSMSAYPGKVHILGVSDVSGEKVFVLSFVQARDPDLVGRPFFARFDPDATWFTELRPAFGQESFFFEDSVPRMHRLGAADPSRQAS